MSCSTSSWGFSPPIKLKVGEKGEIRLTQKLTRDDFTFLTYLYIHRKWFPWECVTKSNCNCVTMLYNGLETYVTAILKNQKFTNFDITTYKISSHTYP